MSVEPEAPLHGFCMYKSDVVRVPCSATSISGRSLNKPLASKGRERERRLQIQLSRINKNYRRVGGRGTNCERVTRQQDLAANPRELGASRRDLAASPQELAARRWEQGTIH